MATMTYNGNKTYDAEFTNWFNNWFTEIEEEMNWDCNISYVSDQQKEEIFLEKNTQLGNGASKIYF